MEREDTQVPILKRIGTLLPGSKGGNQPTFAQLCCPELAAGCETAKEQLGGGKRGGSGRKQQFDINRTVRFDRETLEAIEQLAQEREISFGEVTRPTAGCRMINGIAQAFDVMSRVCFVRAVSTPLRPQLPAGRWMFPMMQEDCAP